MAFGDSDSDSVFVFSAARLHIEVRDAGRISLAEARLRPSLSPGDMHSWTVGVV